MKSLSERLAWLAGILDGEGYLSATITQTKVRRGRRLGRPKFGLPAEVHETTESSLRFQVRVCNTDAAMINEVSSIADALGIDYFCFTYKVRNPRAKRIIGIHFQGKNRTKKLLETVLPWLVTKRPQAELLLQMIKRRDALDYHRGSLSDPMLVEQLTSLRGLNHRGVLEDGVGKVALTSPLEDYSVRDAVLNVVGAGQRLEYPHRETGTVSIERRY